MSTATRSAILASAIALAGCTTPQAAPVETLAIVDLATSLGGSAGSLALIRNGEVLTLRGNLTSFPPGPHAFHLHQIGQCDAPNFKSAGGHLNPDDKQHGSLNPAGAHLGDLPNIVVDDAGKANVEVMISKTGAGVAAIFDADGTSVMLHQDADDYRSDPAGAAGARIACGVLIRI